MALPFLRLVIEPLPYSSRCASLANLLPSGQWYRIRRYVYRRIRYHCQICGREGRMCCHETWRFNEQTGYQYLISFECLCEVCHKTKHYFFARDSQEAGGCPSQSEAMCRVVSAALRCGVDPKVLTEQLKSIRCPSTIANRRTNKNIDVLSCPDAIARAIEDFLDEDYESAVISIVQKCPDCGQPLRKELGYCIAAIFS